MSETTATTSCFDVFEANRDKTVKEILEAISTVPDSERQLTMEQIRVLLFKMNDEQAKIPTYELLNDTWFKRHHIENGLRVLLEHLGLKIDELEERRKYAFMLHKLHLGLIAYVQGHDSSYLVSALNEAMLGTFGQLNDWKLTHTTHTTPAHYGSNQFWHKIEFERSPECRLVFIDQIEKEQPGITDTNPTTNSNYVHLGIRVSDDTVYSLL